MIGQSLGHKLSLVVAILAVTNVVFAQNQGNIWYFGIAAGMDFSTEPPSVLNDGQTYFPSCCGWNESTASISDSLGNLLFYSNGEKVWNQQHTVMPNGNGLAGHASSTHSSLIVPRPGSDRLFYLFTTDAWENNFQNGLRYCSIDMCLDGGMGDVVVNEKNVLLMDSAAEKLACVRHANQLDYWVIGHRLNSDAFYSFLLTEEGIVDTVVSNTGTPDMLGWGGQMVISPNGEKIIYNVPNAQSIGVSMLLDFDTETGVVSNEQILDVGGRDYGAAFSPDNTRLYCSKVGTGSLYQYDLTAGSTQEIIDSKYFYFNDMADAFRDLKLGPNGKLYLARANNSYLSVFHNPNGLEEASNFELDGFYLEDGTGSFGLPGVITNYEYSNGLVKCEHTGIFSRSAAIDLSIFPNPTQDQISLSIPENFTGNFELIIYNSVGVPENLILFSENVCTIDIQSISKGLYHVVLIKNGVTIGSSRFVKSE